MKDPSPTARTTYDTTPATHGDLDIWGGRLTEIIDETKTELKADVNEVKAELKEFRDEVNTRMGNFEDKQNDILLTVKAIEKKLSEK